MYLLKLPVRIITIILFSFFAGGGGRILNCFVTVLIGRLPEFSIRSSVRLQDRGFGCFFVSSCICFYYLLMKVKEWLYKIVRM